MPKKSQDSPNMPRGNTELLILSVLKDGPAYGYSIAKEANKRSDGALTLKQGSIYPMLYTLEESGFIASEWSSPPKGERARRMYRITDRGLVELERRIADFLKFSKAVLKSAGYKAETEL